MRSLLMPRRLLNHHVIDTTAMALFALVVLAAGAVVGDLTLRQWSSLLGIVAFGLLVYRAVATLHELSKLARALVTVLAINLLAGAVAQYLLGSHSEGTPPPPNTGGNALIVASRLLIIGVALAWPRWLNRWGSTKKES